MTKEKRVLFYVQHLLGIGHQRRGATLTRAMQDAGLQVTYVSGGHSIPNLDLGGADFVQLPPVRAVDLYFKKLVDEFDQPIDDAWRDRRRDNLQSVFNAVQPHVLLLELYPFGRRQMSFEILPLLEFILIERKRPVVACSVRDILVAPPKSERLAEMLERIETYFDHVLVHGDPDLIPFEATFPHATKIADKLHYTGYVVDRSGKRGGPSSPGWNEVLISAGGGAVGNQLLRTAMAAKPHSALASQTWRVLVGVKVPEKEFAALVNIASDDSHIFVERSRGDFPSLLMNCALSISQGGYNTLMEAIHAGARSVVVPYAGGLETEQTLRTELLAKQGSIVMLPENQLTPAELVLAIDKALAITPMPARIRTDGARASAKSISAWADVLDWY